MVLKIKGLKIIRLFLLSAQGKLLGKWGKKGLANDEFHRISDIAISKSNKLYLLDDALNRVQVFKIP